MPARRPPQRAHRDARATGTGLLDLNGIGPSGAARLLVEFGDVTRFPDKAHFPSWNGTAPIDASSGDQVRHRLSRGRQPADQPGPAHHGQGADPQPQPGPRLLRAQEGRRKGPMEAMRYVKRRLSDLIFQQMLEDSIEGS